MVETVMLPVGHDGSADSSTAFEQSVGILRAVEELEYRGASTERVSALAVDLLDCTRGTLTRRWSLAFTELMRELE